MTKVEEFLKVEDVSKSLKLHPYTIRRLCREEKIPCFKVGGQWRFDMEEIKHWKKGKMCAKGSKQNYTV